MTKRKRDKPPKQTPRQAAAGSPGPVLLEELDLLWRRREPYAPLLAEIVAGTLERFPLLADQPVVEIGAGTGQLRRWLPQPLRERMVHTDPSQAALQALRERSPEARARVASAERLPFADASCGGVVGLCVFDAISNQGAAIAEIARVLAPGGRFVHLMDMATLLEAPFEKLAASGLVPLPNVFADPGDHEWPLDIVLLRRDWLAGLRDLVTGAGHALGLAFGGYLDQFLAEPFDVQKATNIFKATASSGESRHALKTLFTSATQLALAHGHPAMQPLPFHSGRYLKSVLDTGFREHGGFRIELSGITATSRWVSREPGSALRYRSLCLGHQRLLDEFPARLLTASAGDRPRAGGAGADAELIEAGAFVFVAERA